MLRAAAVLLAASPALIPPASAQVDLRPAAQASIAAIFNATVGGGTTALGYISDLDTYSVSGTGCRTDLQRTQRRVYSRDSYTRRSVKNDTIIWSDIVAVRRAVVADARHGPGVLIRSRNGVQLVYALNSPAIRDRLISAMETMVAACDPARQRRAPLPQPQPQITPRPRPQPQTAHQPPRAEPPKTGFYWVDRNTEWCSSHSIKGLNLFPGAHATLQRSARGSDNSNRLVLSQPLQGAGGKSLASTPPKGAMTARIIVQTPTGTGQARTATLTFDDRPAGVVLDMPDSRYSTANSRDIFLPADFLDRLAYVSSMTLTLKAANGDVLNRYIFDVADAREVRPELIRANWSCVSAR